MPNNPQKILVVDDEYLLRWAIRRFLESEGYKALEAESGPAALEILENESVDILITDIMMPGMDGFELIRKALEKNPELIVLVVTANDSEKNLKSAEKVGARRTFTKPIPLQELSGTIQGLRRQV